MNKKVALVFVMIALALAMLSCRLPWQRETTPVGVTVTDVAASPVEAETEIAVEPATATPTDVPVPSLAVMPDPAIFQLAMFTPAQGWAVTQDRNRLLVTRDGGETWLEATPAALTPLPEGLISHNISAFFLDAQRAWFTTGGTASSTLYQTRDGGCTWIETPLFFPYGSFYFLDEENGFVIVDLGAGAGSHYVALYRTFDSGSTWSEVFTHEPGESKSLPEGGSKNGVTFLDELHGWIGGNNPMTDHFYLYYTADGGATWAQETDIALPAAYAGSFLDVWQPVFVNDTVGYLPVRAMQPDGTMQLLLYRSDDRGDTWGFQDAFQDGKAVDFVSVEEGWIGAGTHLLRTTDGGASWAPVAAAGIPAGEVILSVDFVDGGHGWAIATPDTTTLIPLKLYRTMDGGESWTMLIP